MKKIFTIIIISLLAIAVVGAIGLFLFPYNPINPPQVNSSGSTQSGIQQVINANNNFAFDLYTELDKDEENVGKNIFYSPYSIFAAMAMTYEGANGKTAEEIKSVFHFPERDILRSNFAAIYNDINQKNSNYELRTGNALWVQKDFPLLEDYINRVKTYYGGKATNLDFVKKTETSRQTINNFIAEQTNDKIKDIIPPFYLNAMTRIVLTNAVYFKGTWKWEFDKSNTIERDFKITPENIIKVPTMYMNPKTTFNYADLEKLQIIELPYKGDKISMLIILPKQGEEYNYETKKTITYNYTLEDIELTEKNLVEWKSLMQKTYLGAIYLPKFEFSTKYFMKKTLQSMGMPTVFSTSADFSGMDGKRDLSISEVIHQSYIKVNEEGTEAAAATAVIVGVTSAGGPEYSKIFRADHPFIFLIQEKATGNILFLGKVLNPTAY